MKSKMKRRMLAIVLCMVIVLSNSSFIFASSESGTPAVEAASTEGTTSQTETDTQVTETTPQTLAVSESIPAPTDEPAASDFCGSDSDANRYSGSNDDPGADRHTDPGSDTDTDGYPGNDNDPGADGCSGNNDDSGANGHPGSDNDSGTDGYPGSNPDPDAGTGERNFRYCTADSDTDADRGTGEIQ